MTQIPTHMDQVNFANGNEGKVNITFTPNLLAQFCYYKGIDSSEYINFDQTDKESLVEIIKEMAKLLIEVGEDYRESKK